MPAIDDHLLAAAVLVLLEAERLAPPPVSRYWEQKNKVTVPCSPLPLFTTSKK